MKTRFVHTLSAVLGFVLAWQIALLCGCQNQGSAPNYPDPPRWPRPKLGDDSDPYRPNNVCPGPDCPN
jgi:hypothetical protein